MRRSRPAVAIVLAVVAAGCSGTSEGDRRPAAPTAPAAASSGDERTPEFFDGRTKRWRLPTSKEPEVRLPSGPPPATLSTTTLRPGSGPRVRRGDTVVVNHIGLHYANGEQHDTTYGPDGLPLEVEVGAGVFIEGFERGLLGMRRGERRMVVVPPRLGYGSAGYGAKGTSDRIEPGETLVYVIDLESIR